MGGEGEHVCGGLGSDVGCGLWVDCNSLLTHCSVCTTFIGTL